MMEPDLSQFSMLDLFRVEAETQALVLTTGLLALERDPTLADQLEACMRAAHSLKGAARIVDLPVAVRVAHAMEDCFVAAQEGRVVLCRDGIDVLLGATDLIGRIAGVGDHGHAPGAAANVTEDEVDACLARLARVLDGGGEDARPSADPPLQPTPPPAVAAPDNPERVLRVTAEHLNRLLGLTAESLVDARWIASFSKSWGRLKRMRNEGADL